MTTKLALLRQASQLTQDQLQALAQTPGFSDALGQALGATYDQVLAGAIQQQWATGQFGNLPAIEILDGNSLQGANAAYAASTNTIYVSENFLGSNLGQPNSIASVLLEEFGHYLDQQLSLGDSPGDEGELFSAIVRGQALSSTELARLRAEDDHATIYLKGQAVTVEQDASTPVNVDELIAGLTGEKGLIKTVEQAIIAQVFGNTLPLLGTSLKDPSQKITGFLTDLESQVKAKLLAVKAGTATRPAGVVEAALQNALADAGLPRDAIKLSSGTTSGAAFSLKFNKAVSANPALATDLGLPNLGLKLEAAGNANVNLGYELALNFGVDGSGKFYCDTGAADEVKLDLNTDLSSAILNAKLGVIDVAVAGKVSKSGAADKLTKLGGKFTVNLKDANDRLTTDELATVGLASLAETKLRGLLEDNKFADLNLGIETKFAGKVTLPELSTALNLGWAFNGNSFADVAAPTVAFNDVTVKFGDFLKFASPILGYIKKVAEPIEPLLKVLTTPIDLKVAQFTLLDIAKALDKIDDEDEKFIKSIAQIVSLVKSLPSTSNSGINLGSFTFGNQDIRSGGSILSNPDPSWQPNSNPFAGLSSSEQDFAKQLNGSKKDDLQFPILTDLKEAVKLLSGKNATLFNYTLPTLDFTADYSQFFPIIGPLGAEIRGIFSAKADLAFGYDTASLFTEKGINASLGGFYISDLNEKGVDIPEFTLSAGIEAYAALNLGIASAGVGGGIYANVNFNFNDPDKDGKIRLSELKLDDPLCMFDTSGSVTAGLSAYIKVGYGWFSRTERFESPKVTLLNFDLPADCPETSSQGGGKVLEPVLASVNNGVITLNSGANAVRQGGVLPNNGTNGNNSGGGGVGSGNQANTEWFKEIVDPVRDYPNSIGINSSGTVYLAGDGGEGGAGDWFRQYDPATGNLLKTADPKVGEIRDSATDGAGNVYMLYPGAKVAKYDKNGTQIWTQTLETSAEQISVDNNQNVYVTGESYYTVSGDYPVWVGKLDQSGKRIWSRELATDRSDKSGDVGVDSSGNVYVTGSTEGSLGGAANAGSYDAWIAKYDGNGNQIWVRQFGSAENDQAKHIAIDKAGNVFLSGNTNGVLVPGSFAGEGDAWVAKYSSTGSQLWTQQIGSSDPERYETSDGLAVDGLGNAYAVGSGSPFGSPRAGLDTWIAKYGSGGARVWERQIGTPSDNPVGIVLDQSANIYIAAKSQSITSGSWLTKLVQSSARQASSVSENALMLSDASTSSLSLADNANSSVRVAAAVANTAPVSATSLAAAVDLGTVTNIYDYSPEQPEAFQEKLYKFAVNTSSRFGLLLKDLAANIDLEVLNQDGTQVLASSKQEAQM